MKYKKTILLLLTVMLALSGCSKPQEPEGNTGNNTYQGEKKTTGNGENRDKETPGVATDGNPSDNRKASGGEEVLAGDIQDKLYAGYSENIPTDLSDVVITCLSGSSGCYIMEGTTVTFTGISEDSVYAISGNFKGNIVIDVSDDYKFDLEMHGLSISNDATNPITVLSGDKVTLTAKKDYQNYIYDMRPVVDENDSTAKAGAIYSEVDLRIAGKGELTIVSENNNGIHTKDDLEVKNLTLTVWCVDNSLKGNDSVTLENATTTLIATTGDGIKTTKSDISGKGNQKGTISVLGGTHNIYAACDGLDAAYDVVVDEETTVLNIFTDKYSGYSEEVTDVAEDVYYIRFNSKAWKYSVKYYNSDEDFVWVNPEFHSTVSGGRNSYYYYSFPRLDEYAKIQFYIYAEDMVQGQETEYLAATDYLSLNDGYDTFALENRGNNLSYSWTNYTTKIAEGFGGGGRGGFGGGPGGMGGPGGWQEGNSEKGDHSTKGIKAANEVKINAGTINIKSYDDAVHAKNDDTLENGQTAKGNVTINGGMISMYSNDDGIHADGAVDIKNGTVTVSNSYEGIEGSIVEISGGKVSVNATDDGINATIANGTAVTISGGELYIYCTGDGIDSNSRTSYEGIVFSGGNTMVISNSGMNSAIDSENGYKYEGGQVVAIMPSKGMSQEALQCENFSAVGSKCTSGLILGRYADVMAEDETVVTFQIPAGLSAMVVYLGSTNASVSVKESTPAELDTNGVCWYK